MVRGRAFLRLVLLLSVIAAALAATHSWWLSALGRMLVRDEGPRRADLAVVLAGDSSGNRILKAAELVREGYIPAVLVSGPSGAYGSYECELAIAFAVRRGCPRGWFIALPMEAYSTDEEARVVLSELRRRRIRRFLLVTSDYHSARAARIYHSLAPDLSFRTVAAPDRFFSPDNWWHHRQGRKQFVFEWTKTIATAVGL